MKSFIRHIYNIYITAIGQLYKAPITYQSRHLGIRLKLHPDHLIDFLILRNDVFQPEILACIDTIIQKANCLTFIDIGAHIGQMSLYVAKKYPEIKVIAFEPNPEAFARHTENKTLNQVKYPIHQQAIGEREGDIDFYIEEKRYITEYLKFNDGRYSTLPKGTKSFTAKKVPLDHYLKSIETPVLIKIDVEGNELEVLKGARQLLENPGVTVITELLGNEYPAQCQQVIEYMKARGYELYNLYLQPIDTLKSVRNGDYIFIRNPAPSPQL